MNKPLQAILIDGPCHMDTMLLPEDSPKELKVPVKIVMSASMYELDQQFDRPTSTPIANYRQLSKIGKYTIYEFMGMDS